MRTEIGLGVVKLVDFMGRDDDIVHAARVSYDPASTSVKRDSRGLIRYLYRHKHTTPFEMCELKFYLKMPIFVARQWVRHRTANINEYSGRYSIMKNEFYVPDEVRVQSKSNKQGSDGNMTLDELLKFAWEDTASDAFELYKTLVSDEVGVARELARIHLPLSTYTEFYWKIDLHNLLHFLKLRTDPHAQLEIRQYAGAMEQMVSTLYPLAYEAWVDYSKEAYNMSRMEIRVLRSLVADLTGIDSWCRSLGMTDREIADFRKVLGVE